MSQKETETSLHNIESIPTLVLTRCFLLHFTCLRDAQMAVKLGKQWSNPKQSITPRQESVPIAITHLKWFRWAGQVARMGQTRWANPCLHVFLISKKISSFSPIIQTSQPRILLSRLHQIAITHLKRFRGAGQVARMGQTRWGQPMLTCFSDLKEN
jgi:hypothetical protein